MQHFVKESQFRASPERLFAFHERPDALALLTPSWQKTEVLVPPTSLAAGTRVKLRTRVGPFWQNIEAEHVSYEKGRSFADRMVKGPFRHWLHHHLISASEGGSMLRDEIEYELPLGALGQLGGGWFVRRMLEKLFAYRHDVTRRYVDGDAS
jgi:ligand-binding SRPBCC domain-containing protein